MKQNRSREGYILPMTLLVLACTLLWGSALLLTLSDQYAASDDMVKHEQSRLLARSGWNLALAQLEEDGSLEDIQIEKPSGCAKAQFEPGTENQVRIVSSAESGGYASAIEGTIRFLELPWKETEEWEISETVQNLTKPGIFCTKSRQMALNASLTQPLALISVNSQPITVSVSEPVCCTELFVHGDLIIEEDAFLEADAVYVSGEITGSERITGSIVLEQYTSGTDYHVQVLERLV